MLIQDGLVLVNGEAETRRRAKIRPGDEVVVDVDPRIRILVEAAPAEPTTEA